MSVRDEENLKDLFERFVDSEQARRCAEDIQKAERIVRQYPAPEPSEKLIADIKARVAEQLAGRKVSIFRKSAYKIAGVAAVFVVVTIVSLSLLEKGSNKLEMIPTPIWESQNISADDEDLAILSSEVEQIENQMLALRLGETGVNEYAELAETEMELIEIDGSFWKG